LDLLVSKNILSVPIYDQSRKNFIGIIDMYQIMTFMAFAAYSPEVPITLQSVQDKVNLSQPAAYLLGSTGQKESDDINSLWKLPSNGSLKEPLEFLGKGIYRILVTAQDVLHTKIITQTDLVRFLHKNWDKFPDWKNCSLKDNASFNVSFLKRVFTVNSIDTAIQGFQLMRLKQVNALAVVNESGTLVTTLSDADLRGFTREKLETLLFPITQFLTRTHGSVLKPVVCHPTDSLKTVLDLLISEKVHRIWIVDDHHKPIGVVSLTDIALFFYSHTLDYWYPPDKGE